MPHIVLVSSSSSTLSKEGVWATAGPRLAELVAAIARAKLDVAETNDALDLAGEPEQVVARRDLLETDSK
ncbi:MAG: hypothetical protein ABI670_21010 [Chloroflexota bacterium]